MFDIQLDDPAFKLNEQVDCGLSLLPKDVDWTLSDKHGRSLFLELFSVVILNLLSRKDSGTLYAYALKTRAFFCSKKPTFSDPTKAPFWDAAFCQTGTKNLVDPILNFEQFSSPEPSSSEEEADLEQVRRQQERVIIRCDVDDEDVDINLGDGLALEVCEEKKNGDLPLKGSPSTLVTDSGVGNRICRPTIRLKRPI